MWRAAVAGVLVGLAGAPAGACFAPVRMDLRDILFADVVVIGSLPSFEIVEDESIPDREAGRHYLGDYARLTLDVHEVLKGEAPDRLVVTWASFELENEDDPRGDGRDYLVALRANDGSTLPMRGVSYTANAAGDPDLLTVMQAPCAQAFIFQAEDGVTQAIRQVLDGEGDAEAEADAFAEAFQMDGGSTVVLVPEPS